MNDPSPLRIGSRASPLARTQTMWVASQIGSETELIWVRSEGDRDRTTDLNAFGGVGVFTAALHQALFDERIDAAVHSLKDLPAGEEEGVQLACVPVREDPRDVLVARDGLTLATLPQGAKIGTGSPRRAAQLKRHRPDLRTEQLRGNVDTRLARVHDGSFDATVLALAGLRRLGKEDVATEVLPPDICLPAAGQGALGITARAADESSRAAFTSLHDAVSAACVHAERTALHALGAGCHAPVGALAVVEDGALRLRVRVLSVDGTTTLEEAAHGAPEDAGSIGHEVAAKLIERGAGPLLAAS